MPSADAYAAHLAGLERAEQVIAHHHALPRGLSGGQAIGALMGRHYSSGPRLR